MIAVRSIVLCIAVLACAAPAAGSPEPAADGSSWISQQSLDSSPGVPESRQVTYPCKCAESQCSCCSGNVLQNFNFNFRQRLCTNISYSAEDFEFNVRILFNDYTIYHRVVSGRNPRPVCVPIFPPAWTQSRVCLKFSNVYFVGRNVHVCLSMEAQTQKKPVFAVDFNCVRMGTAGVALLKPEDGGGLPGPQDPPAVGGPTSIVASSTAEDDEETETETARSLPLRRSRNIELFEKRKTNTTRSSQTHGESILSTKNSRRK